jgi:KDO2-lipid IV(A) lauroyltransferase
VVDTGRGAYLTYRGLSAALQVIPRPVAGAIASSVGFGMSYLRPETRRIVHKNMRRVLGPDVDEKTVERFVEAAFDSYAHYWVDAARLGLIDGRRVDDRWTVEGMENIELSMARGKGTIIALPHVGNWEYGGLWLAQHGYPMVCVAEVLEPPELYKWFVEQRERLGLTILPLQSDTTGKLLSFLREGRLLGLVADRDLVGNGIEVEFFGEMTTLPAGPATLALRSGADLMTTAVYHYRGDRHHAKVNTPIDCTRTGSLRDDVRRITQQIAREMEVLIRRAPEQWHMFQANWPSDRDTPPEHPLTGFGPTHDNRSGPAGSGDPAADVGSHSQSP